MARLCVTFMISLFVLVFLLGSASQRSVAQSVNVTTAHQDIGVSDICSNCVYRTGENLNEDTLTYNTLSTSTFGKLCEYDNLEGQVYGQPLGHWYLLHLR